MIPCHSRFKRRKIHINYLMLDYGIYDFFTKITSELPNPTTPPWTNFPSVSHHNYSLLIITINNSQLVCGSNLCHKQCQLKVTVINYQKWFLNDFWCQKNDSDTGFGCIWCIFDDFSSIFCPEISVPIHLKIERASLE